MSDITYREYWDEVASLAKQVTAEAREDGRDISEVLHETIDGHNWVIYTYKAQSIIRHSQNADYAAEQFGPLSCADNNGIKWSAIAYGCLYGDVSEHSDFDADPEDED